MDILPIWDTLRVGESVSFVGQSVFLNNNNDHLFRALDASRFQVVVRGTIPDSANVCTFLDLLIIQVTPMVIGCVTSTTKVWPCPPCNVADMYRLTEMCCGMGAFSSMGSWAGFEVILGIDENPKWKQLFQNIHHSKAVYLTGDIGDTAQIDAMLSQGAMHTTMLAGISCQPHSTGGDKGGMNDPRSTTLHKALKASWLTQSPLVILECVPGVLTNTDFQKVLTGFCSMIGACLTQQIIRLSNVWCAKRDRWFACISAGILGPIEIPDLPVCNQFARVEKVMPSIRSWPETDMQQIVLSLYEVSKFHAYVKGGISKSFVQMQGTLPTSLHSAGNQLYPCRCGCRQGLSLARLQEHGLYGVLVPMGEFIKHEGEMLQQCRYLHPIEMYLLNGGVPNLSCDEDLRLTMAAIGQFVSPIQGLWVLSHVAQHVATFLNQPVHEPNGVLLQYIEAVIEARDELWQVQKSVTSPQADVSMHDFEIPDVGGIIRFAASPKVTVGEFLRAESALQQIPMTCDQWQSQCVMQIDDDMQLQKVQFVSATHEEKELPTVLSPKQADSDEVSPTIPYDVVDEGMHSSISAMLKLQGNDFLALVPPSVDSISGLQALRQQLISQDARMTMLHHQGSIWGDDEISFALQQLSRQGTSEQNVIVWDPLLLSAVIRTGQFHIVRELVKQLPQHATVITAFVVDKHWHPMIWRLDEAGVYAYTCGLVYAFSLAHQAVQKEICKARGAPFSPVHNRPLPFIVNDKCGAMAISYIRHLLLGETMPASITELQTAHEGLRSDFTIACQDVTTRPWLWANGQDDFRGPLSNLLLDHGVEKEEVAHRSQLIIEKLGQQAVQQSFKASNPWRELKWNANQLKPPFQLIKPSELQKVLDQKMSSGKGVGNRTQKHKSKGKGKGQITEIDPSKLRVEKGTFVYGQDRLLTQIDIHQIGPAADGIVLCDVTTAAPYLKGGKQLSAGGLAFVVLAAGENLPPTALIAEKVRLPVLCTANAEPLLIEGYLYQLGAQPVRRNITPDRFKLESVASCVGKFTVYRDQLDIPWDQFVQHPLKHLFSKVPVLQPCQDEMCGGHCEMWHQNAHCHLLDPILEIWNKQWLSHQFSNVSPDRAEIYAVCIRLPISVQMQVQSYSGSSGIFVEPRSIDGRQPSDQFQVVWLPKMSGQELVVLKQMHPSVCGLARMGLRYGLRCRTEHAASLHESVKPTSNFLPQGRKRYYLVGPVPYGTIKSSMAEALLSVGWKIRPLQTVATPKQIDGIMWKVQSTDEPPRSVIQLEHGEVLVTKLEDPHVTTEATVQVVGSDRTKQLCSTNAKGRDPLQQFDPWASWGKSVNTTMSAPVAEEPLANLEKKVLESVMAKLPKETMEVDGDGAVDRRFQDLEQRVLGLQDGQQQLANRIQEQGATQGNQIQQLYAQSTRLEASVQDQSVAMGHFQTQFRAQLEQQQGQLDSLFRQQMDRIEELMKKQRRE